MYNPSRFKSDNMNDAFELMDKNPFATVISVNDGKPMVSHLPLTPRKYDEEIILIGHLAKANPHWKILPNNQVTVIFNGPHTYITPVWYAENDVPTWNYSTVHVSGSVELIETYDGIVDCLKELTSHVERYYSSGWSFFIPDDLQGDILPKNIVGFKIKIESINFKNKMSQNRSSADRVGILKGLDSRADDSSRAVLKEMRKLFSSSGEQK